MPSSDEMGLLASDAKAVPACAACLAELDAEIAEVLRGQLVPEDGQALQHLRMCPECADAYGDALWMSSSSQITALQDALLGGRADVPLEGFRHLWRWHFGLRNQYGEPSEIADALSVLGMICRQQGDWRQAMQLHRLALENCSESLVVQVMSKTDLGFLALRQGRIDDADRHMAEAAASAKSLGDRESERRIGLLQTVLAVAATKVALAMACLRRWLRPYYVVQPGGTKVFVVNTCTEVPLIIQSGPEVDREGNLRVVIKMDRRTLSGLPEEFFLDLVFLPTAEILCSHRVEETARGQLLGLRGLEIKAKLPYVEGLLDELGETMEHERSEWRQFPPTGCTLRIRW